MSDNDANKFEDIYSHQSAQQSFARIGEIYSQFLQSAHDENSKFLPEARTPEQLQKIARALIDEENNGSDHLDRFSKVASEYRKYGVQLHSPQYMGHQVPPPLPFAGAMDGLVGGMNQGLAVAEMSPFATAIEEVLVTKLCETIGYDAKSSGGVATSGGTLANLTAILAARNRAFPNSWQDGCATAPNACMITSQESHYSISRSAGIIGTGLKNIIAATTNAQRQMTGASVRASIENARKDGKNIFCVVASAPSTPIGAIDEIDAIADVCREYGIWLHVDAVHGGPMIMAGAPWSSALEGINKADSVSWDAHKMMHVPSLCTFVLYRKKLDALLPFENRATYLFEETQDGSMSIDLGKRTFECTKRALSAPLWAIWSTYGTKVFQDINARCLQFTRHAHELINGRAGFESPYTPQSNILVFRYVGTNRPVQSVTQLNELQIKIRKSLMQSGEHYITQATLDGVVHLRLTLINPLTDTPHLKKLLSDIEAIGTVIQK
jgi:L-2,4-diaminobutyrate decarboxylase